MTIVYHENLLIVEQVDKAYKWQEHKMNIEKIQILSDLVEELKTYELYGIPIILEGEQSTPIKIAEACVLKDGITYMRDYVEDEKGVLSQLRFDRIEK